MRYSLKHSFNAEQTHKIRFETANIEQILSISISLRTPRHKVPKWYKKKEKWESPFTEQDRLSRIKTLLRDG